MQTILHSDRLEIKINCYFEIGNRKNNLPLDRDFLIVEVFDNILKIENGWDLLYTYSVKDIRHVNSDVNSYIFTKLNEVTISMFNGRRCVVYNKKFGRYLLCVLWNVDTNEVDFLCKYIDDFNVTEILTSGALISRYEVDVLNL